MPDIQTFAPLDSQTDTAETAETTIASFSSSSCSYLSPFSTNATFIVLGGEECDDDEIFIKPKNLVQPEISVQPPSPLMPRIDETNIGSPSEHEPSSSRQGKGVGIFSKLFKATNTVTMAPVVGPNESSSAGDSDKQSQKLGADPLSVSHEFRRAISDQGTDRRFNSSPAPNIPAFDKFDIQNIVRQNRSCSESECRDSFSGPISFHQAGVRKSLDLQSRKISLDFHSGRVCKPSDQGLMKTRSYSVTAESVSSELVEVKKDGGSKIWRQLKGTGIFKVGRVASVFSSLNAKKNKNLPEAKQDFKSLCKYISFFWLLKNFPRQ